MPPAYQWNILKSTGNFPVYVEAMLSNMMHNIHIFTISDELVEILEVLFVFLSDLLYLPEAVSTAIRHIFQFLCSSGHCAGQSLNPLFINEFRRHKDLPYIILDIS